MSRPDGLVFRDTASWRRPEELLRPLRAAVKEGLERPASAARLSALLAAGALECALADRGDRAAARAAGVTDGIADAWWQPAPLPLSVAAAELAALDVAGGLRVSPPEGFAYYGLHPRLLAEAALGMEGLGGEVLVIGIRTIGATLSAAVRAALTAAGRKAERITVRPGGHPFDRRLAVDSERSVLEAWRGRPGASFLVVDEGPGLSGSSFLGVGEMLEGLGIEASRIQFLGTRPVDPMSLRAPDAARRWPRYRFLAVNPSYRLPAERGEELSGGRWRGMRWQTPSLWPAVWPAMERLKFRSADGRALLKFEGLGPYGSAVYRRALALSEVGLAPRPLAPPDEDGYVAYPWVEGRALTREELDPERLALLGRAVARRREVLPAEPAADALEAQSEMARYDLEVELGVTLRSDWRLPCERPAVVDGRMLPHEWLLTDEGALIKVDGVAHGDDHFFPGPTDVAWDLAGLGVEWRLGDRERAVLVAAYERASGDRVSSRLGRYELAYAAFRSCQLRMAARSASDEERTRLVAAYRRCRRTLRQVATREGIIR